MVRTKAAVIRAAMMCPALKLQGNIGGLQIVVATAVISRIGGNQGFLHAMRGAALEEENLVVLDQNLRRHEIEAGLTERRRLAVEDRGFKRAHVSPGAAA
jgi:hypothetical protein